MADGTIVLNQTYYSQQVRNVLVWNNMVNTPEYRTEMADAIRLSFLSNVSNACDDGWTLDNVTFIYNDVAPIFSTTTEFSLGPLQGGTAGVAMPTQSCLLVSTSIVGPPPNRGRIYFAGQSKNQIGGDSAQWSASRLLEYQTMVEEWRDGLVLPTAGSSFLRIARRDAAGIITLTSGIQDVTAQPVPAGQSRRRIGRGS